VREEEWLTHALLLITTRALRFTELCLGVKLTYLFVVRENYYASYFSVSRFQFFRIVTLYHIPSLTTRALRRRYTFSIPSSGVHRMTGQ
jgi:hypothetical protein